MFKGFFTVNHLPRPNQSVLVYNSTIFKPTDLFFFILFIQNVYAGKKVFNKKG